MLMITKSKILAIAGYWRCLVVASGLRAGLDTNGCPLGNSKFILLSDNLNICLWLSACQVEKINQLNNSWSNMYQWLSQPEATFPKYKHIWPAVHSFLQILCFFYALKRTKSDWRATLDYSRTDLLLMVSLKGVLLVDHMMSCQLSQCGERVASSTQGHTLWIMCQQGIITTNWLINVWVRVFWTNRTVEL